MKMKKVGILAFVASFLLCTTGCADSDSIANNSADVANDSVSTETSAQSVTAGYIKSSDGDGTADLCSAEDDNTVIAKMFDGDGISVYSINGEWANVSYGGQNGYVRTVDISFTKEETTTVTEGTTTEAPAPVETTAEVVTQAADNSSGDTNVNVNITMIMDDDGFEYADPMFLDNYKAESAPRNGYCNADSCYIHAEPNENSAKRDANMLYNGDAVTIEGSVGDWYYIATDSGNGYDLHGYVKICRITIGTPPADSGNYNASYGKVTADQANVRSTPNKETDDNVLFTVYKGQEFEVYSYDGYWYKVNINGTTCYISHKMVEVW